MDNNEFGVLVESDEDVQLEEGEALDE